MKNSALILCVASLLVSYNSYSADSKDSAAANPPSADMQDPDFLYLEAERSYIKSDMRGAVEKINGYFAKHPRGTNAKQYVKALNLRGLIYFQLKNSSAAMEEFGKAAQAAATTLPSSDPTLHLTRYNLANALYSASQITAAADVLLAVEPSALDADTRARYFHLLGNIGLLQENSTVAVMAFAQSANLAKTPEAIDGFLQKAAAASKRLYSKDPRQDLAKLQELSGQLDHSLPGTQALQVWIARGLMYSGRAEDASDTLKKFLDKSAATHPLRERANELLAQLASLAIIEPNTVGLLLPLSGKFGKFGRLCMNSAFFAGTVFEDMTASDATKKIKFIIRDSGDTAESAAEAFDRLVMENKVVAVIGPLLSKQASAVAQKAQEYGVPLLSLSQKRELENASPFIFPIALSPDQQIETILDQAIGKQGLKRFAIMAPSDAFGDEYVKLFWDSVEKRGAEIVGVERYEPKSTDFRDELNRLLGLEFAQARTLEQAELKRRETAYAATLKVKGGLRKRLLKQFELKAVPMFDAVFIPDDPQVVGQLVPAFAVRDVDNIPYLGINTWNTPEIVQRAGRYLQNSLFVDSFFPYSQNPLASKFVSDFNTHFQTVPGTLEVQAYDAAGILLRALNSKEIESRSQLRDQLINLGAYKGISGTFVFSDAGVKRSAYLLTIKGTGIAEINTK